MHLQQVAFRKRKSLYLQQHLVGIIITMKQTRYTRQRMSNCKWQSLVLVNGTNVAMKATPNLYYWLEMDKYLKNFVVGKWAI